MTLILEVSLLALFAAEDRRLLVASGARIMTTLVNALQQRGGCYIGDDSSGEAIAAAVSGPVRMVVQTAAVPPAGPLATIAPMLLAGRCR